LVVKANIVSFFFQKRNCTFYISFCRVDVEKTMLFVLQM